MQRLAEHPRELAVGIPLDHQPVVLDPVRDAASAAGETGLFPPANR